VTAGAGERLSRLLALVPWLVAHDGVTMAETAAHFGVSEVELERDLWLVVVCGIPGYGPDQLVDIQFWDDGVIHVLDPQTLEKPLRLTHEEAVTLLVALRMLAQLPGVVDRDSILTAAAKIERLTNETASSRFVAVQLNVPLSVTAALDLALAEGRELAIRYAAATRDEVSERTVRPIRVLVVDGIAYLEAYCTSAAALRTFRLDRVLEAHVGDIVPADAAEIEMDPEPPAEQTWAVLALDPSARWVIDVHAGTETSGTEVDGRTVVRMPLHSLDWATRLVLSLRGAAIAREPAELRSAVAEAAEAARAAYP
jgi:proteasome accessory factor C